MAEDLQHRLAMAAAAGMLAGLVACSETPPPGDPSGLDGPTADPVGQTDGDAPDATDVAAGDKGCCGPGTNACEGKGACATDANACAGKNACEGKGGCYAKDCAKEDSRAAKQAAASPADPPVSDDAPEGEAPAGD